MPRIVQEAVVSPMMGLLPASMLNLAFSYPAKLGERGRRKVNDYLTLIHNNDPASEYYFLMSLFDNRDKASLYTKSFNAYIDSWSSNNPSMIKTESGSYLDQILMVQYENWLQDVILMKQDKMSMAHSIEARVPFLDHELVEFLFQAPPHLKLHKLRDKILLRNYMENKPSGVFARRTKKPFYIPVEQYLHQDPLKFIVEECLSESSIRRRGYFNWDYVKRILRSTSSGEFLFAKQIFSLTNLELWHRIFIDRESGWLR